MLCSNRPEGFGPSSTLSHPLPTTCFTDTILLPIPIWLALGLLPVLYLLTLQSRKRTYNPSTAHLRSVPRRSCLRRTTSIIYYLLIIANILMEVLEIVRLELLQFGIGLLPFVCAGLLLAGFLHWSQGIWGRVRGWEAINGVVWVGGIVMSAVKVVGLSKEGMESRKGSKYPLSDQVLDVAVMAGVYAVIGVLEIVLGFWRRNGGRGPNRLGVESVGSREEGERWAK